MSRQLAQLADYLEREIRDREYDATAWSVPYRRARCAIGWACAMGIPGLKLSRKKEPVFKRPGERELTGHKAGAAALGISMEVLHLITDPLTRMGVVREIRTYLFSLEF